jgi:hypothetical protein
MLTLGIPGHWGGGLLPAFPAAAAYVCAFAKRGNINLNYSAHGVLFVRVMYERI